MGNRYAPILLIAIAAAMIVYCAVNLRVGSDITRFLPDDSSSELAALSSKLTDSALTRTIVVSIGSADIATAISGAREIADALRDRDEVAWVRSTVDEAAVEALYEVYFPHRMGFLSDDPEKELPARLTDAALRERARSVKQRLASPASGFFEPLVAADPLGAFEAIVSQLRNDQSSLQVIDEQFVTADGRFAIILLASKGSAFDSGAQGRLLGFLHTRFDEINARHGGALDLELSAAGAFAIAAERDIKRDIKSIAACSLLGVALLFGLVLASLRGFLITSVPPMVGILTATTLGVWVFGKLDGITLAFGTSLMGIVIDYSNHILLHHGLAQPRESPMRVALRLRPSLVMGALTTVASFVGLGLTSFPAFREMSFFAITGVLSGLAASIWILPPLLEYAPELPARSSRASAAFDSIFRRLESVPVGSLRICIGIGALAVFLLPRLEWSDDLSRLTRFDDDLVEEDRRVRERVAQFDTGRFLIALAPDVESAMRRNEELQRRLVDSIAGGALEQSRSLHALLWSEELQRRNLAVLAAAPDLYDRLDAAFAAEGFRPGAFHRFGEALREPPEPLLFTDLQSSPLADLLTPYVIDLEDRIAVVTYLRGLQDVEAVRATIAGMDDVYLLEQRSFVNNIYREFRQASLQQVLVGAALVLALLGFRYRSWRPVIAAFLPSALVAVLLLAALAAFGQRVNLLHVMSLIMVMGMGVDYGIFCVDSIGRKERIGVTLLSLLLSCLTTAFVFGTLAISSQPALRAIGVTTGIGVILSFVLAPIVVAATRLEPAHEPHDA